MDNAPAHTAVAIEAYFDDNNIFHFKTPAQSPDLNPIELVWHDLKQYVRDEVKPNSYAELIDGIFRFWNTKVTIEYCNQKINHVRDRVLDRVIQLDGRATGL